MSRKRGGFTSNSFLRAAIAKETEGIIIYRQYNPSVNYTDDVKARSVKNCSSMSLSNSQSNSIRKT